MTKDKVQIGILGFGNVGQSVYELLHQNKALIDSRIPVEICVKKIAVKNISKDRGLKDTSLLTDDVNEILNDSEIKIVVELIGDSEEAFDAIRTALKKGKAVVTANKAAIAKHGPELFHLARENKTSILFEASVGGGIPILKCLRESLNGNQIQSLRGIINGTSNYILSQMQDRGAGFSEVLKKAQELGYAETDPTSDVEGIDAAYKLSILIMLCHGVYIPFEKIYRQGISDISPIDFHMAESFDYSIKHMGITKKDGDKIEARVHPVMVPKAQPIAHVNGAFNAVEYYGNFVKEGMLTGHGAGGHPTASAVVGDIIETIYEVTEKFVHPLTPTGFNLELLSDTEPKDMGDLECPFYLRVMAEDKPNVLSRVAAVLGNYNISIQHVYQQGFHDSNKVPVVVFTHKAKESSMQSAIQHINNIEEVLEDVQYIRIEE